jgi:hypothetical protein
MVPLLLPYLLVWQSLVRQAGQTKACVADADSLVFISHDVGRNIDERPLPLWHHQTGSFSAMDQH